MNNQSLSPSDCVNVLKHISQISRNFHMMRIKQEFKLVVSVITLFVGLIAVRYIAGFPKGNVYTSRPIFVFNCAASIAAIFVIVMSYKYLNRSKGANALNQAYAEAAEDAMEEYLITDGKSTLPVSYKRRIEEKKRTIDLQSTRKPEGREFRKTHPNLRRWLWQWITILFGGIVCMSLIWISSLIL